MVSDAIALVEFLAKSKQIKDTKRALFSWEGALIDGNKDIEVQVHRISPKQWFYSIKEIKGFEFIYLPVIPAVYTDYGLTQPDLQPDARFFRFVGHSLSSFQQGGAPNVRVSFLIYGYRPSDLLMKHLE